MHLCVGYVLRSKTLTVEDGLHNANALWYNIYRPEGSTRCTCASGTFCGAKQPTEFGVKLDLSVDEFGMARLEKQSFDAYNELDTTTMSSVSLSVIAMNVDRLMTCSFFNFIRYISESVFRVVFRIFITDAGVKTRLEMGTI